MGIGASGRIVIELEPEFKRAIYAQLESEGRTLKEWFVAAAQQYVIESGQLSLFDQKASDAVKEGV